MSVIFHQQPFSLYASCTAMMMGILTPLKSLIKARFKHPTLVHVLYCGDGELSNTTALLSALPRISPALKCSTNAVRECVKMTVKNSPENEPKKLFIIPFDATIKEPFRRIWKGWQYRAPKGHYRLVLIPIAGSTNQPSRIVGDFKNHRQANDAACLIECPDLYKLTVFNSRAEQVISNAGSNSERVKRERPKTLASGNSSNNSHRPISIERLCGLTEKTRKGTYRSR